MKVLHLPVGELAPVLEEQLCAGTATLPVTGGSMLPMLRGGRDMVRLAALSRPPVPGDVLFYRRDNGQYVLHRLIDMEDGQTWLMCGDNQWQREVVAPEKVIARVEQFRRDEKWINCNGNKGYLLYTKVWMALFPVRRPILAVRRVLGRLRAALRKNGK